MHILITCEIETIGLTQTEYTLFHTFHIFLIPYQHLLYFPNHHLAMRYNTALQLLPHMIVLNQIKYPNISHIQT